MAENRNTPTQNLNQLEAEFMTAKSIRESSINQYSTKHEPVETSLAAHLCEALISISLRCREHRSEKEKDGRNPPRDLSEIVMGQEAKERLHRNPLHPLISL
eukprot:c23556_g1_i2 orf=1037-1342(+)